jgi:NAD(P)-dependent dehydrogenase (short-subunit alcohol dehydrogenase family)
MSRRPAFSPEDIGDLTGKVVLITGATSGIGREAAVKLAAHGALVVLGCRDIRKGEKTADHIMGLSPDASVEVLQFDLADLSSVRAAAGQFDRTHDRIDVLVNNAGVMGTPYLLSADGNELQFATNHLGHFALTGLLLPVLLGTDHSRVVTVSSHGHRQGNLHFDNLQFEHGGFQRARAYGNSKLANLLFTYELDRRLRAAGGRTIAVAVHPGWTRTALLAGGPTVGASRFMARASRLLGRFGGQSAAHGALPTLYAATADDVRGGEYFGPGSPGQMFGPPKVVSSNRRSRNLADARRLWDVSEELTGVTYQFMPTVAGADTTAGEAQSAQTAGS